ncbi:glycosyltransferase involved in cell wall biosynthesis [Leifsonia sp. AK011]|uniref:glycosyltransferase family 2 protein n=1 Tax=Leifsonia sp. AK011 TaxID=2723075 RepID=UPI0015CD0526|nr:glycosyltransferase family 2 protein [Leifsonia sp. AK011]NYF11669.1 glycosyltransferase involved in cell wall biosynthesis [Leifsonia sp. AK011]
MQKIPLTVVVLTKNEEAGIAKTLGNLREFEQVVVVDSNSDDRTVELANEAGVEVVNFTWNGEYPKKKQWAIENCKPRHNWILLLDADEYPSAELVDELRTLSPNLSASRNAAFDIHLSYRFAGKFLKFGHRVTKRSLLNPGRSAFPVVDDLGASGIREVEGHYQPVAEGPLGSLRGRLLHDDQDPVSSWFERHNRYSDWEAHLRLNEEARRDIASKRTAKGAFFDRVPFKPLVFFLYSYFGRLGFLDGRAGFDYTVALSMYYWQIGVKVREKRRSVE